MVKKFYEDLATARQGERIAAECFKALTDKYEFQDVAADPAYYHKGDILAIDKETGRKTFIEVKYDSRIADTRNVLLEDEVDYYGSGTKKGYLHSNYEIYAIVSPQKRKILVLDFEVLKKHYTKGTYKFIPHADQASYCYLLSIDTIEQLGGVIAVVDYNDSNSVEVTYLKEKGE